MRILPYLLSRLTLLVLAGILVLPVFTVASLFRRSGTSSELSDQDSVACDSDNAPLFGPDSLSTVQRGIESLQAHDQKSDCFKEAARALRQGCRNLGQDGDEKTKYAIRLTVCEMSTADLPIPNDCLLAGDSAEPAASGRKLIKRCISKLGGVPQHWTSYTGNFREVNMMCLAVRFPLEQDQQHALQESLRRELKVHRDELSDFHKQGMDQLKELLGLHLNLSSEVKTVAENAVFLRDTLRSLLSDSTQTARNNERMMGQQEVALSELKNTSIHFLHDFQSGLAQIQRSVQDTKRRALDADDSLGQIQNRLAVTRGQVEEMEIRTVKGGDTIKEKFRAMADEISTASDATVKSVHSSFGALEHESEMAWQKMMLDIELELTKMHRMVSDIDAIQSRSIYPLRFVFRTLAMFIAAVNGYGNLTMILAALSLIVSCLLRGPKFSGLLLFGAFTIQNGATYFFAITFAQAVIGTQVLYLTVSVFVKRSWENQSQAYQEYETSGYQMSPTLKPSWAADGRRSMDEEVKRCVDTTLWSFGTPLGSYATSSYR